MSFNKTSAQCDFQFSAVTGGIDYRVSTEDDVPIVEWAWVGDDDGSESSGWAVRDGEGVVRTIFMFGGDEFQFEAFLAKPRRTSRGA